MPRVAIRPRIRRIGPAGAMVARTPTTEGFLDKFYEMYPGVYERYYNSFLRKPTSKQMVEALWYSEPTKYQRVMNLCTA